MKTVVLKILIALAILFVAAIFIYPEPNKDYSGFWWGSFAGGLHGNLLIPNWIISFFDESRLIKASSYDGYYNFAWWVFLINQIYRVFLKPFVEYFKEEK